MNCKQGDTARIIKSANKYNVGQVVSVVRRMGNHPTLGAIWLVRGVNSHLIVENGHGVQPEIDCADDDLEPLPLKELTADEGGEGK